MHKLDGVIILKIVIAMLENLTGEIDEALPIIIRICANELLLS